MPVEFLTDEQKSRYGQFAGEPNEMQLVRYFHLDQSDLDFICKRRGDQNRLGFALQLTSVRFLGTFLSDPASVPGNVQIYIASQLSIKDAGILSDYAQRENTRREHTSMIREQYGYREFGNSPWSFRLSRLLYARSWVGNERPSLLFDFATAWLIKNKVLLPGATTPTRLISRIRDRANKRLWLRLASLPSKKQKANLEALLLVPEGNRVSLLDLYQQGPITVSGPSFIQAVERYKGLMAFGMRFLDFSRIPPVRLKILARHASMISTYKIDRMPDDKRTAMLVAFVRSFEVIALDEALDVLDLLITDITGKAKKAGQKERLRTIKDLDKSALVLAEVCSLILNENTRNNELREAILSRVSVEKLKESINTVNSLARPIDDNFYSEIVEQYGRVRRFLPKMLQDIDFNAAPAGKAILEAFKYLATSDLSGNKLMKDAPLEFIPNSWKRLVFDKEGRVTKRGS
jgi:hypothetical protein